MSDEAFVMMDRGTDGKLDLPQPPKDMAGQLAWLKAMTEEQERLKNIEEQFKKQFKITGNAPETTAIIKEFMPPEDRFSYSGITAEIPMPRALWHPTGDWPKEDIQQHHDDMKRLFPDTKIQKVTFKNGSVGFAYTGMNTDTMASAIDLVRKERAVKKAIEEQSEKLGKTSPQKEGSSNDVTGTPTKPSPSPITQRGSSKVKQLV